MNVIVIGCGRTGATLARTLVERGHAVAVIDDDPNAFSRLGDDFVGRTITGVAFDHDALRRAGIEEADAVAVVTDDEDANLITATIAKRHYNIPRVVARLFSPEREPLYAILGVPTVTSVSWRVRRLEQILCHPTLQISASLGHGEVVDMELSVGPELAALKVSDLHREGAWTPTALIVGGKAVLPQPERTLEGVEMVRLTMRADALEDFRRWLRSYDVQTEAF